MKSIQEMTRPLLEALSGIFNARAIRVRIIWRGSEEHLLLSDEQYVPEGTARIDTSCHTRQIPMLFDSRVTRRGEDGSIVRSGRFAQLGAEASHCPVSSDRAAGWGVSAESAPIVLSGAWRLVIERSTGVCHFDGEVHGFRILISVLQSDRGLLHGRLERAGILLDLFGAMLDSHGPPCCGVRGGEPDFTQLSPPMLGESLKIRELRKAIRMIASSPIPLLIEGESGTGKEVLARNAHNLGPRRERPLVILNCLEVPRSLMQSELFGHLKGSFTGASRDRAGLVESAGGGTLFLDEIGEMPRSLQAALLRVLQEREVRRIGESRRRSVDVRFVFATNCNLEELVGRGRFRKDLFYRMCGVRLCIPPLRARRQDIPMLTGYFLESVSRERGERTPHVTAGAMSRLMSHDWPGNVRELKHEMERALALHPGVRYIHASMLSPRIGNRVPASPGRETIQRAVRRLETDMIEEALDRFNNNRTRAAAHLGITRQGLLKKLKRYGIATRGRDEK